MDRQFQAAQGQNQDALRAGLILPSLADQASGSNALSTFLRQIGLANLGSSTVGSSTQPFYSNPTGEAASALGSAAYAGNLLFGQKGLFPNAVSKSGDYLSSLFGSGGDAGLSAVQSGYDLGGYGAGYFAP